MSEDERERIHASNIFARVSPEQKLDIVSLYQHRGETVAMTGDGVNDAPALEKADIGVAMGLRGTDAAKEVSDMVLTDDSFPSIVAAVEQGRIIFDNIRKSAMFMLCTNAAEVLVVGLVAVAGPLLALPLPLKPLQILYLNVLTDVFPALALAVGRGGKGIMDRPPRSGTEGVLAPRHWRAVGAWSIVLGGVVMAAVTVGSRPMGLAEDAAVTLSFLTLGFAKLWFSFNLRDPHTGILDNPVSRNPWIWGSIVLCTALLLLAVYLPGLSSVLRTVPLDLEAWGLVLGLSLVPLLIGQVLLAIRGYRGRPA
jgi:Ca2+-transporting ATPase